MPAACWSDPTDPRLAGLPAGRALGWYLATLASPGAHPSLADAVRRFRDAASWPRPSAGPAPSTDEELHRRWAALTATLGEPRVVGVDVTSATEVRATLEARKGRRWTVHCVVEAEAPHRIVRLDWERLHDAAVVVREATPADAASLADLERRSPVVMGEARTTFDRGRDYFAAARLMEDVTVVMAEVDGVPAAVEWAAWHRARIGEREYRMTNYLHLRVLPEHQRRGLWGALVRRLGEVYPLGIRTDCSYACAARTNAAVQHGLGAVERWTAGPWRAHVAAAPLAGGPYGRPAHPGDAADIAALLNAAHAGEALYLPHTAATVRARLERAPDLYSWRHVWIADGAVLGVWPAGDRLRVVTETAGHRVEARRGLVLDHGFLPGAEAAFVALLRAAAARLHRSGHTHLSLLTAAGAPAFSLIRPLAESTEAFDLLTPGIPEPAEAARRGVYVDAIYF